MISISIPGSNSEKPAFYFMGTLDPLGYSPSLFFILIPIMVETPHSTMIGTLDPLGV